MDRVVPSLLLILLALSPPAAAQFSSHEWTFTGTGSAGFTGGSVSGNDELTLEILNCIGYAGKVKAESVAHDTGRYAFDLSGEEWVSDCTFCGSGYCGDTTTWADNECVSCFTSISPSCSGPQESAIWGGACFSPVTWSASWEVEVVEAQCWQIGMTQDGWSLDCNSRIVASNLTFLPAPDVTVLSVTPTPSFLSTAVTVTGTGLEHVTQVFVDGVETAILSRSAQALVIRPPVGSPGVSTLTLRNDEFLLAVEAGALAQWPTLEAGVSASGQELEMSVDAGVSGPWQLIVSLGGVEPLPLGPAIHGALELDIVGSPWFWIPGTLDPGGTGALALAVPQDPGLSGLPVHVQALAPAGQGSTFHSSFSNADVVALP